MTAESEQKVLIRNSLIRHRDQLESSFREQKNQAILERLISLPELISAKSVFCFISYGSEVNTLPLLDWLQQQGKAIAVPKILNRSEMAAVEFKNRKDLESGPLGVPTPVSTIEFKASIDLCITPGVGFTATGKRLGYGLGYYDKWFASHPVRYKLGLCYECQLVDELPVDEYDIPVNIIITEERIFRV